MTYDRDAPPDRDAAHADPLLQRSIATPGGYAWWYVDALAPSGDALVCILLVGAPFSPDYAARLRAGERALPLEHCAVNLALDRRGRQIAWVMSEYGGATIAGDAAIQVGGTVLDGLRITVDDLTAP